MPALKIQVPDDLVEELKSVWQFNKRHVRPDILKRMGWNEWEAFLGDILAHGYKTASAQPLEFMRQVRDNKDPIFVDPKKRVKPAKGHGKAPRPGHEFERAYS